MISVIIFAIILTIIATAYIKSVGTQQKNALNNDLSTRAYYSAESGIQDALREVRNNPALRASGQNTCSNGGSFAGGTGSFVGDLGYTCQLINTNPTEIVGNTERVTMIRINPSSISNEYTLRLSWSRKIDSNIPTMTARNNTRAFTGTDKWSDDDGVAYHPMVRANLISLPVSGINRSLINQYVYFLNPVVAGANPSSVTTPNMPANPQNSNSIVQNGACYNNSFSTAAHDGEYSCSMNLVVVRSNFTNREFYLRLSSLYGATDYKITMASQSGDILTFQNNQVSIDVTGKAGDVYRRVKQTFPITNGFTTTPLPDASIIAGDGICKQFTVGAAESLYETGCRP